MHSALLLPNDAALAPMTINATAISGRIVNDVSRFYESDLQSKSRAVGATAGGTIASFVARVTVVGYSLVVE